MRVEARKKIGPSMRGNFRSGSPDFLKRKEPPLKTVIRGKTANFKSDSGDELNNGHSKHGDLYTQESKQSSGRENCTIQV